MQKTDRLTLTLVFALIFAMALTSFSGFFTDCDAVRQQTLRLHIIANSDSEYDQQLKFKVRDAVLSEYSDLLGGKTAEQAALFADFLKGEIELTAQKTLLSHGCTDSVKAEITDMYFDTKSYREGATMPAGQYTALRLIIGEGKGQNWWCVLYPPLCIPACMSEQAEQAAENISALEAQPAVKMKFAVVELACKIAEAAKKSAG